MDMDSRLFGVTESPDTKDLVAALAKAQQEFKPIKKSGENSFAGFRYPTFSDMAVATYPALNKHGLVMQWQEGSIGGREVLVGRLRHSSGQWVASTCPVYFPVRKGEVQEDGQGLEIGNAYARKTILLQLTGAWLEGSEPEVEQDQTNKAVDELTTAPAPESTEPKPQHFSKLAARLKAVRSIPAEVEKTFVEAEALAQSGELTADELARLTRTFGALRRKGVTNAHG